MDDGFDKCSSPSWDQGTGAISISMKIDLLIILLRSLYSS